MATANIRQFNKARTDADGLLIQIPMEPGTNLAQVSYTTSQQSAEIADGFNFVTFQCSAKCHYKIGTNPTATASDLYGSADERVSVGVAAGQKIAFYDGTS